MSRKDDGGSAFPGQEMNHDMATESARPGMTLRDYFAAKALQGWLAGSLADGSTLVESFAKTSAKVAYEMADAMLEERER